jgi:hypothetical protein
MWPGTPSWRVFCARVGLHELVFLFLVFHDPQVAEGGEISNLGPRCVTAMRTNHGEARQADGAKSQLVSRAEISAHSLRLFPAPGSTARFLSQIS